MRHAITRHPKGKFLKSLILLDPFLPTPPPVRNGKLRWKWMNFERGFASATIDSDLFSELAVYSSPCRSPGGVSESIGLHAHYARMPRPNEAESRSKKNTSIIHYDYPTPVPDGTTPYSSQQKRSKKKSFTPQDAKTRILSAYVSNQGPYMNIKRAVQNEPTLTSSLVIPVSILSSAVCTWFN